MPHHSTRGSPMCSLIVSVTYAEERQFECECDVGIGTDQHTRNPPHTHTHIVPASTHCRRAWHRPERAALPPSPSGRNTINSQDPGWTKRQNWARGEGETAPLRSQLGRRPGEAVTQECMLAEFGPRGMSPCSRWMPIQPPGVCKVGCKVGFVATAKSTWILALKAARVGTILVLRARHRAAIVNAGPGGALHRGAGAGMVPTVIEEHESDPKAVRVR